MLGPALVGRNVVSPRFHQVILACAAAELIADKSARIGNRTDVLPLSARIATGALAAAASQHQRRGRAAVVGALAAGAGTFAWFHFRRLLTTRFGAANLAAGLVEDAVAVGLAALLLSNR